MQSLHAGEEPLVANGERFDFLKLHFLVNSVDSVKCTEDNSEFEVFVRSQIGVLS